MDSPEIDSKAAAALAACERAVQLIEEAEPAQDAHEAGQRRMCVERLFAIAREIRAGDLPPMSHRRPFLAQMVADQWDPREEITSAVIAAEQAYLSLA